MFLPATIQTFVANQRHFFKENIAVSHIHYTPKPHTGFRRTAPARALNCTAEHTSHLSAMRKPKIITTSKPPQSYENTNCASQPANQLASKVPNSFLDLLLREVTGQLHLPGISLRHKPDSASLNQTDQLKSQHGQ